MISSPCAKQKQKLLDKRKKEELKEKRCKPH